MKSNLKNNIIDPDDLDEVDRKIIKYLQKNGRETFTKMGDEIGVPASTVRDRTNRLVENDILRIVGILNPPKASRRVIATIGIKLSGGNHRDIARQIARFDKVSYLVICSGSFDLMAEVICKDNAQLLDLTSDLQNIPGVLSTETFIFYTIVKEVFDLGEL